MNFRALPLLLALIATPVFAAEHPMEQRKAIRLSAEGKAHIHMEMRQFLSTTQKIVSGAAANDMKMVAGAAHEAGMAAAHDVPPGLRAKLPLEFKKLGQATHQGFDDLARDADSLGDANHALKQLSQVLGNCVSCHALYRIETR
jgi:cytochrome c556